MITFLDLKLPPGYTFWGPFKNQHEQDLFIKMVRATLNILKDSSPVGMVVIEDVPKGCEALNPEKFDGFNRASQAMVAY